MLLLEKENKPLQILLVEDNPTDAKLAIIAFWGFPIPYHLNVVENGLRALDFLRHEGSYPDVPRPDLIILDWNLPLMNGKEVLEVIRRDEDLKKIPVVVLSVSDLAENISEAYSLGAKIYVTKPMGLDRFAEMMADIIKVLYNRKSISENYDN